MAEAPKTKSVTFHVQLVPEYYDGIGSDGRRVVYAIHPERMTRNQPRDPLPGAVVVPVTLEVDVSLFGPTEPVTAIVGPGEAGGIQLTETT